MTYVFQLSDDPHFFYGGGLVPKLMGELVASLNEKTGVPAIIRAAMGHLNLVTIHPFSDGNGKIARCLQTLILSREQIVEPLFCSIEEYLGWFTDEYYDVLAAVGKGVFHPENDSSKWIKFNLVAHFRLASWLFQRSRMTRRVWNEVEQLLLNRGINERALPVLVDAAFGYKIRRSHYMNAAEVSEQVASKELRLLVDNTLLVPEGETQGRTYKGSPMLRAIYMRNYERTTRRSVYTRGLAVPGERKNSPSNHLFSVASLTIRAAFWAKSWSLHLCALNCC